MISPVNEEENLLLLKSYGHLKFNFKKVVSSVHKLSKLILWSLLDQKAEAKTNELEWPNTIQCT